MADKKSIKINKISSKNANLQKLNKNNPFGDMEDDTIIMRRNQKTEELYAQLKEDLDVYLMKISNQKIKSMIQYCSNNNLIYYGDSDSKKNYGSIIYTDNGQIGGYVLNYKKVGVNVYTGDIDYIDELLYTLYFLILRSIVVINFDKLKNDKKINNEVVTYLRFLFLKAFNIDRLGDKQKELFKVAVTLFYEWKMLNQDYNLSKEHALESISNKDEFYNEIENIINDKEDIVKNYDYFKDIFKYFIELGLIQDSPNQLIMKFIKTFKSKSYMVIFSTLDFLIANSVISKYPFDELNDTFINKEVQDNIENYLYKYYNENMFDVDYMNFYN